MVQRLKYTHVLRLHSKTSTILDQVIAKSTVPTIPLPATCQFSVSVSGVPGAIVLMGSLNGDSVSEQLTFNELGTQYSVNEYDTLTRVETIGFNVTPKPRVLIRAVDGSLQPITWSTQKAYPCKFQNLAGMNATLLAQALGVLDKELYYIRTPAPIQKGDIFSCNGLPGAVLITASAVSAVRIPGSSKVMEYVFYAVSKE